MEKCCFQRTGKKRNSAMELIRCFPGFARNQTKCKKTYLRLPSITSNKECIVHDSKHFIKAIILQSAIDQFEKLRDLAFQQLLGSSILCKEYEFKNSEDNCFELVLEISVFDSRCDGNGCSEDIEEFLPNINLVQSLKKASRKNLIEKSLHQFQDLVPNPGEILKPTESEQGLLNNIPGWDVHEDSQQNTQEEDDSWGATPMERDFQSPPQKKMKFDASELSSRSQIDKVDFSSCITSTQGVPHACSTKNQKQHLEEFSMNLRSSPKTNNIPQNTTSPRKSLFSKQTTHTPKRTEEASSNACRVSDTASNTENQKQHLEEFSMNLRSSPQTNKTPQNTTSPRKSLFSKQTAHTPKRTEEANSNACQVSDTGSSTKNQKQHLEEFSMNLRSLPQTNKTPQNTTSPRKSLFSKQTAHTPKGTEEANSNACRVSDTACSTKNQKHHLEDFSMNLRSSPQTNKIPQNSTSPANKSLLTKQTTHSPKGTEKANSNACRVSDTGKSIHQNSVDEPSGTKELLASHSDNQENEIANVTLSKTTTVLERSVEQTSCKLKSQSDETVCVHGVPGMCILCFMRKTIPKVFHDTPFHCDCHRKARSNTT